MPSPFIAAITSSSNRRRFGGQSLARGRGRIDTGCRCGFVRAVLHRWSSYRQQLSVVGFCSRHIICFRCFVHVQLLQTSPLSSQFRLQPIRWHATTMANRTLFIYVLLDALRRFYVYLCTAINFSAQAE